MPFFERVYQWDMAALFHTAPPPRDFAQLAFT